MVAQSAATRVRHYTAMDYRYRFGERRHSVWNAAGVPFLRWSSAAPAVALPTATWEIARIDQDVLSIRGTHQVSEDRLAGPNVSLLE